MKTSTVILALAVCCSCMLVSQAFIFGNENMLMWMMMMNPQMMQSFGGGMGGGMPLWMLASGSDKMKTMGTGLLLSQMMRGGGMGGNTGTGTV